MIPILFLGKNAYIARMARAVEVLREQDVLPPWRRARRER